MGPKVTIIGGGSSSFVPVLIRRLMQSEALEAARVSLMDIDEGRLGVMQALADKLIASEGSDIRVTSTLDQREALVDADFVIAAIAEGGMDAWANDLEIPGALRHRHADRRLARAGRDHARLPQRAGARAGRPQRRRGRAATRTSSTTRTRRRSRRSRCAPPRRA